MNPPHNPNYIPSGPNNKANPYYKRINTVRLARGDSNRTEFFGTVGGGASAGSQSLTISFAAVADPVLSGTRVDVQFDANFSPVSVQKVASGDEQRDSFMAALSLQVKADPQIDAVFIVGTDLVIQSIPGVLLNNGNIVITLPMSNPPPPPPPSPAPPPDTQWTTHAAAEAWLDQFTAATGLGTPLDWSPSATLAEKYAAALQLWDDFIN